MALQIEGRPALLINECQRGVLEPEMSQFSGLVKHASKRAIVPRIAHLAEGFRRAGFPVIHTPAAHRPDFADALGNTLITAMARKHRSMIASSPEVEFVDALRPNEEDFVVWRSSGIVAMLGTSIDAMLRRMRINTLVLAGVSTNLGIAGCAIAAAELGYVVLVAEDCIAGSDPETHAVIVKEQLRLIARIVTADEILKSLPANDAKME